MIKSQYSFHPPSNEVTCNVTSPFDFHFALLSSSIIHWHLPAIVRGLEDHCLIQCIRGVVYKPGKEVVLICSSPLTLLVECCVSKLKYECSFIMIRKIGGREMGGLKYRVGRCSSPQTTTIPTFGPDSCIIKKKMTRIFKFHSTRYSLPVPNNISERKKLESALVLTDAEGW